MRLVAIIQARVGSTRLPGKVLMPIGDRPMIDHVIARAARIGSVTDLAVAIPDRPEDDRLADHLQRRGDRVIRGPADDVLLRYLLALEAMQADAVLRVTADCPLLSPTVSTQVVEAFLIDGSIDYASNTLERTWPRGLDTEVIAADALRTAGHEAVDAAEREHVTPYLWRRPERFRLRSVTTQPSRAELRLTVDTVQDLELVRRINAELGHEAELDEVLALVDRNPELANLNAAIRQKPVP